MAVSGESFIVMLRDSMHCASCSGRESAARAPRSSGEVSEVLGLYTHDPRTGELRYSALPYLSEPLRMDT